MGVKNAQFRCRSGENGQILRSHLFKNPGRIVASKCCQVVKNDRILADEWPFQHFLAILAHFMPTIVASKCCEVVKNDRILADEWPFQHFLAILAHFIPTIASKCCQVVKNDRILADEGPFQHFLAILAHFMPTSTRIFENGTARFRCLSGVSRALLFRSETISKVGNIKIMSARSPFFFSPLSPPFSFLSRVVSRLMGVRNAQFRCRSGENGQILRSHLFKNPGRIVASKCCQVVKNDRILADEWPFHHFLAILAHFMPTIVASKCCQVVKNDRILADEWPFQHFLAILAHFIPTSTRSFENGTARFRCLSGVSRALRLRSETISKVGNIKIMIARSPFFFSRLSSLLFSLPCGF